MRAKGADIFRSKGIPGIAGEPRTVRLPGGQMLLDGASGRGWNDGETQGNRTDFIEPDLDRDGRVRAHHLSSRTAL
nr:GTP-binding protein [Streptantibioticus ferralitis]